MSKKVIFFLVAVVVGISQSEDPHYKNSVGWDDGLSYRYSFSNRYFLGSSLFGAYNKNFRNNYSSYRYEPDPAVTNASNDSMDRYDVNISLKIGKEIVSVKWIKVNFIISPYGDYYWQKTKSDNTIQNYEYKRYLLGSTIGFEPAFTLFERFTFGSKFGLDCNFQRTVNNSRQIYSDGTTMRTNESNSEMKDYNFSIFGTNFSTNLRLFGLYNF